MLFAEIDATGWTVIIGAVVLGIGGITTSALNLVIGYKERKLAADREDARVVRDRAVAGKVEVAAVKVEEVRETLKVSQANTEQKLVQIHDLVNSQLGRALSATATLARWKADQTKSAGDVMAADIAERSLADHIEKQAVADATKKSSP